MRPPETTILYGDAWELAATLEPQSIDCIVGFELNDGYQRLIDKRLRQGVLL